MKSVWIVTFEGRDSNGHEDIVGVCSSEVGALVLIEQQPYGSKGFYEVEEYEVREAH